MEVIIFLLQAQLHEYCGRVEGYDGPFFVAAVLLSLAIDVCCQPWCVFLLSFLLTTNVFLPPAIAALLCLCLIVFLFV